MSKLIADTVLMIEPIAFGFNEAAAETNSFQQRVLDQTTDEIQHIALHEFIAYVDLLRSHGIKVVVFKDEKVPYTPDSIFPNNWFSTDPFDRSMYLFPMANKNRADERRKDIIDFLSQSKKYTLNESLLQYESQKQYLEGTGSMVLDHQQKIAYACLSPRTNETLFLEWCDAAKYEAVSFTSHGSDGSEVYHTNVVMTMADKYVVICLNSISDQKERTKVKTLLQDKSKKEIIDISMAQMNAFAGNMMQLRNESGDKFLVMSNTAKEALNRDQISLIENTFNNKILAPKIDMIETIGGGSARCMIAELF